MFGGSPFLSSSPGFPQRMPVQGLPGTRYVNEPLPQRQIAPAWQERPAEDLVQQPSPRGRVIRGQSAEELEPQPRRLTLPPPPAALTLPPPEELGVAATAVAAAHVDWDGMHRRLERLGALAFHQQKLAAGGCRITLLLPTDRRDRIHQVEADASTEADALSVALDRAEQWAMAN